MTVHTPELAELRKRAFLAMGDVERSRAAVEAARQFQARISPHITREAADSALQLLRRELQEQLVQDLRAAQALSAQYCAKTRGDLLGKRVRCHCSAGGEPVELRVAAVLWGNWQLGEDSPSFSLLSEARRDMPDDADAPCLGAAVWTIELLD